MTHRLGLDGYLQYDTTGVATPTWVDYENVEEINLNLERAAGEIKNRASNWGKVLVGKLMATLEVTVTYDSGDGDYEAFRDAFLNGTDIGVYCGTDDIATSGSEGLVADMKVTAMSRGEPLEESMTISFTLQPSAASATEPSWNTTA